MLNFVTWQMRMIDFYQHFTYRSLTQGGIQVHVKPIAIPQKTGDCEKASHSSAIITLVMLFTTAWNSPIWFSWGRGAKERDQESYSGSANLCLSMRGKLHEQLCQHDKAGNAKPKPWFQIWRHVQHRPFQCSVLWSQNTKTKAILQRVLTFESNKIQ